MCIRDRNKTAQRIILDLKDKVKAEDILSGFDKEEEDGSYSDMTAQSGKEAVEALVALGYSGTEAAKAVRRVEISEGMTAEDCLLYTSHSDNGLGYCKPQRLCFLPRRTERVHTG